VSAEKREGRYRGKKKTAEKGGAWFAGPSVTRRFREKVGGCAKNGAIKGAATLVTQKRGRKREMHKKFSEKKKKKKGQNGGNPISGKKRERGKKCRKEKKNLKTLRPGPGEKGNETLAMRKKKEGGGGTSPIEKEIASYVFRKKEKGKGHVEFAAGGGSRISMPGGGKKKKGGGTVMRLGSGKISAEKLSFSKKAA